MRRCLQLAVLGGGNVAPNPLVGAVLVHDGRIIGEGFHQKYGQAHAEVNCINSVAETDRVLINEATLYVSLEPCAHHGKTPPCAALIIKHNIPNVVIGCRDSYVEVDGKGIEKLKASGVNITFGILEKECLEVNKRFFTFHEKHRPYIILKWAESSDGKIAADANSRLPISNEFTNCLVHKWRTEEATILVGTNTALLDNPSLTARLWPGNNPVRLVIDAELILPTNLKLFDGSVKTVVFNYLKNAESENLIYYQLEKNANLLPQILDTLYNMQIQSVIVEGGAKLLQSFIDEGLWDEAIIICNEELKVGNGLNAPMLRNNKLFCEQKIYTDKISFYKRQEGK
jgi:diaminohydroxyphosphoribosylaminopyrimidine deaminase/5-amino-6-(5-phosphoribosylamino)uracil reductase